MGGETQMRAIRRPGKKLIGWEKHWEKGRPNKAEFRAGVEGKAHWTKQEKT